MKFKLIKTASDYRSALSRIEAIFGAKTGTPEGEELDLLSALVELYEEKAFPIALPDPLTAIRFRMEQQGLKGKDLIPYMGSASKVSEVLRGRRALSLSMMRKLVAGLGIPAEVFLSGKAPKPAARRTSRVPLKNSPRRPARRQSSKPHPSNLARSNPSR